MQGVKAPLNKDGLEDDWRIWKSSIKYFFMNLGLILSLPVKLI